MSVDEAVAVFRGAPFRWWIAGGNALELHVGDSWRSHDDMDVGVCRFQLLDVYSWLEGWELFVAAGGELRRWEGEPLTADRHEANVWLRRRGGSWELDLTVGEGDDHHWTYRRDPSLSRPWGEAVLRTDAGVPYLAPEFQLLFKFKEPRTKDTTDAQRVIPTLGRRRRDFLASHVPEITCGMPSCATRARRAGSGYGRSPMICQPFRSMELLS